MELIVDYSDDNVVLDNPKRRFVLTRHPDKKDGRVRIEVLFEGKTDPIVAHVRKWMPECEEGWSTIEKLMPFVTLLNDKLELGMIELVATGT